MLLSVVIVNYNVKNLLRKCLDSVLKASTSFDCEIWVVDNASADQSVNMIRDEFPTVQLIENEKNVGFAKANNQALHKVSGEYVLILNPDTVVSEQALLQCLDFARKTENCGGIGLKMVDSDGRFLKESKRGIPTPWASFCRFSHLSKLFPRSAFFNRYYMGQVDRDKCHKIDVLAGAFIFIKNEIVQKIGGLDERYFMFGEDIDFSLRIQHAGYDNYYLGNVSILHHKGKSTDKNSHQYIERFYGAMKIFTKRYYPNSYPFFALIISLIIVFKKAILKLRLLNMKHS